MRHDGAKLSGLLAAIVIGQAFVIGYLISRPAADETELPRTVARLRGDGQAASEARETEAEHASLAARRRASRLAALERGLGEARSTVRDLRRRLEETEIARADLARRHAAAQARFEDRLATAEAKAQRQANLARCIAADPSVQSLELDYFSDGDVRDARGRALRGAVQIQGETSAVIGRIVAPRRGTARTVQIIAGDGVVRMLDDDRPVDDNASSGAVGFFKASRDAAPSTPAVASPRD